MLIADCDQAVVFACIPQLKGLKKVVPRTEDAQADDRRAGSSSPAPPPSQPEDGALDGGARGNPMPNENQPEVGSHPSAPPALPQAVDIGVSKAKPLQPLIQHHDSRSPTASRLNPDIPDDAHILSIPSVIDAHQSGTSNLPSGASTHIVSVSEAGVAGLSSTSAYSPVDGDTAIVPQDASPPFAGIPNTVPAHSDSPPVDPSVFSSTVVNSIRDRNLLEDPGSQTEYPAVRDGEGEVHATSSGQALYHVTSPSASDMHARTPKNWTRARNAPVNRSRPLDVTTPSTPSASSARESTRSFTDAGRLEEGTARE